MHIEAREMESKKDWIQSKYKLVHNISTGDKNPEWRFGLSKTYGYLYNLIRIHQTFIQVNK